MPIELKMPALSPTMEEGTLAKWLVKEGDEVKSGDILAEIETDKATMEFEAVDEGKIAKILVPEGTDGVKVGAPIAIMAGEGEEASKRQPPAPQGGDGSAEQPRRARRPSPKADGTPKAAPPPQTPPVETPAAPPAAGRSPRKAERANAHQGLAARAPARRRRRTSTSRPLQGSGPGGRIVRADVDAAVGKAPRRRAGRSRRRCATAPRHARADRAGHPARGGQALQHAQDDRAPPDRSRSSRSRTSI